MSIAQQPSRRHHYIPIFYTKWWASPNDGLVERFTKHRSRVGDRRVQPSRCFWEDDLYSIPGADEDRAQIIEDTFFKPVDDAAARVLRKLNAGTTSEMSQYDTDAWIVFVMSLLHRSPQSLAARKAAAEAVWQRTIPKARDEYSSLRAPTDPLSFEDFLREHAPAVVATSAMKGLPSSIVSEKLGKFLTSMHWQLFDVPWGERDLLLSDEPLVRTNGISNPGGHLALALSPRRLIVGAWEPSTLRTFSRTPIRLVVKAMNTWSVTGARHFVVATDLSQARFVRQNFGIHPKPSLHQVGEMAPHVATG